MLLKILTVMFVTYSTVTFEQDSEDQNSIIDVCLDISRDVHHGLSATLVEEMIRF